MPKKLFVLIKGNLQGATKAVGKNLMVKKPSRLRICKKSFLESYKILFNDNEELSYLKAKNKSVKYNRSAAEFFKIHTDWIKTDQEKYYKFT